ncbi:MAG: hypothetical protein ACK4IA_16350 [Paracoccus hibiscisoli]|uniref:hypothetical protein n=1 Tax=Paracoccus hibiscisoli TaxID=2023261 RepID=UPI00391DCEF4
MHRDYDPQHDRRHLGAPDYDELRDYLERKDDDRTVPAIYWIIPGLIFGALFWAAMWWLAGPAIIGMADASVPAACRDAGAEIVACAEGMR